MNAATSWAKRAYALMQWLKKFRYVKFGLVGASGTLVNIAVLYLAQEYLFAAIEPSRSRLSASLVLAILIATLNNFTWNRLWTWSDRQLTPQANTPESSPGPALPGTLATQFGRYAAASWFGMLLQFGMTLWLSHSIDYRLANILSIVAASVINFLANDRWTFKNRPKS